MTAETTIAAPMYTIGELAAISGLSVHTLRWYEAQGLFPRDIPRTPGGRRIFSDEAVRWLALLNRLRDSAMPVADMAEYSRLVRAGEGNEADRIALMESHARSLDTQIEELVACREVIRDKITFYRRVPVGLAVKLSMTPSGHLPE